MFRFTREWINNFPKTLNENGCWIPAGYKPHPDGYVSIVINYQTYNLHRLSMCIYHNVDYWDPKIDTRHSKGCSKACFNPEHLQPGTSSENQKDSVIHGTHFNASKDVCPKCGGPYSRKRRRRYGKELFERYCRNCANDNKKKNKRW